MVVTILVAISQINRNVVPGSTTFIEIEQLPRMYQMDTSRLKVEIFHLKMSKDNRIPRRLPVKFHSFNFHGATNRWYLTKSDFQDMLPEFTIIRIEPDTVWFSPWYSEVRKLPVHVDLDVPSPFDLVEVTIEPDSIPVLLRGSSTMQDSVIHLGKISTRRDLRQQHFTFKTKDYLPSGTATSVQTITVNAEIGQWKPVHLKMHHTTSTKTYLATVYAEIPVDDAIDSAHDCIRIYSHDQAGFKATVLDSENCRRIRHVKLLFIHAMD